MRGNSPLTQIGDVSGPLWAELRQSAEPRSLDELVEAIRARPGALGAGTGSCRHRLGRWRKSGFVEAVPGEPTLWSLNPSHAHRETSPYPGPLADDVWRALRQLGRPAPFAEILAITGGADRSVYCRLIRFHAQGVVDRTAQQPTRFRLAEDAPDLPRPPSVSLEGHVSTKRPNARARMWATMRILKAFDIPALMMSAEVTRRACDEFLNLLARAGYVAITRHRANEWASYRLLRNTGPKHPTFNRPSRDVAAYDRLFDHNTGAVVELLARLKAPKGADHVR